MKDHIYIGSAPHDETCAQVGRDDYRVRARAEMNEYIRDLRDTYGEEPYGADLMITWNAHDFGTYGEVICQYNPDNETATRYAFKVEAGTARWTQRAADALAAKGYAPFDYRPEPNEEQRNLWKRITDSHVIRPYHPAYGDPEWTHDAVVIVDARTRWPGGYDAPVRDEVNAVAVHRELTHHHAEVDYTGDAYVITDPQHTVVGPLATAATLQAIADIVDTLTSYGIMDEGEHDEVSWRRWADAMDDYGHRDIVRAIAHRVDVDDYDEVQMDDTIAAYAEAYAWHHGTLDHDDATPNVHGTMVDAIVDRMMRDADEAGYTERDAARGHWTPAAPIQW